MQVKILKKQTKEKEKRKKKRKTAERRETRENNYMLSEVSKVSITECGVLLGLEVEIRVEYLHELFLMRHAVARQFRPDLNILRIGKQDLDYFFIIIIIIGRAWRMKVALFITIEIDFECTRANQMGLERIRQKEHHYGRVELEKRK